jgi:hypothetical protein
MVIVETHNCLGVMVCVINSFLIINGISGLQPNFIRRKEGAVAVANIALLLCVAYRGYPLFFTACKHTMHVKNEAP